MEKDDQNRKTKKNVNSVKTHTNYILTVATLKLITSLTKTMNYFEHSLKNKLDF